MGSLEGCPIQKVSSGALLGVLTVMTGTDGAQKQSCVSKEQLQALVCIRVTSHGHILQ